MKRIINTLLTNKYLWFFLFFMQKIIVSAHDCSSPGDCEETAGYNAAVAIVGGVVALGAGIIGAGITTPTDEYIENEEEEYEEKEEDYDEKEEEEEEEDEDEDEDEIDDLFDDYIEEIDALDDDIDDFIEEIDEIDAETEKEITNIDAIKKQEKGIDKILKDIDAKKKVAIGIETIKAIEKKTTVDKALNIASKINTVRVLVDEIGVRAWKIYDRTKEMANATKSFYDKIKSLNNKGFKNLVKNISEKLNHRLRWRAKLRHMAKSSKIGKFMKGLGFIGDLVDVSNSLNKISKVKGTLAKIGKASEETLRFIMKKGMSKFPPVAIIDAIFTVKNDKGEDSGILDVYVDRKIENVKEVGAYIGKTAGNIAGKIEDYFRGDPGIDKAFRKDLNYHKNRINKQPISKIEKKKKLRKLYKLMKKRHNIK